MKKKIIACVTSAVLFSVALSVITACGGAKGMKGYEVTKEQWDAAFELLEEYENCDRITIDYAREMELRGTLDTSALGGKKVTGGAAFKENTKAMICYDKQSFTKNTDSKLLDDWKLIFADDLAGVSEGKKSTTLYAERTAAEKFKTYSINKEGTEWESSESAEGVVPAVYDLLEKDANTIETYLDLFDFNSYRYSSEDKGYVLKESEIVEEIKALVIKFNEEGLLTGIYFNYILTSLDGQNSYPVYSREEVLSVAGDMKISYDAKEIKMP